MHIHAGVSARTCSWVILRTRLTFFSYVFLLHCVLPGIFLAIYSLELLVRFLAGGFLVLASIKVGVAVFSQVALCFVKPHETVATRLI